MRNVVLRLLATWAHIGLVAVLMTTGLVATPVGVLANSIFLVVEGVPDSFTGKGQAKDAVLYRFKMTYGGSSDKPRARLVTVGFEVTGFDNMILESLGEMRLVLEETNSAEGKIVARSRLDFAERKIVFNLDEGLDSWVGKIFILKGDFLNLSSDAWFRLKISERLFVVKEEKEGVLIQVSSLYGDAEAHHREGNWPPILTRVFVPGGGQGVWPKSGRSGETYKFGVSYTDLDKDRAQTVEVWIDLDGNGIYGPGEKFPLVEINKEDVSQSNKFYGTSVQVIPRTFSRITYRFFASDGKSQAEGEGTKEEELIVSNALIINPPRFESREVVRGEHFQVTYPLTFFYANVRIDWSSVARNNFAPFKLESHTHKDRRAAGLVYDTEELVLVFFAPNSLPTSLVKVPDFQIESVWWDIVERNEKKLFGLSPDFFVKMVPLRARMEVLPTRIRLTVGDQVMLRLSIVKERGVDLVSDPEKDWSLDPLVREQPLKVERRVIGEVEELIYTAVVNTFLPVGPKWRSYKLPPYVVRYKVGQVKGEYEVKGGEVVFGPILVASDYEKMPPLPKRGEVQVSLFTPVWQFEKITSFVAAGLLVIAGFLVLRRPVAFIFSVLLLSERFMAFEARREWRRDLGVLARAGISEDRLEVLQLERSFRRYVGYVCRIKEENAQGIGLEKVVKESGVLSEAVKDKIVTSLNLFFRLSESKGEEKDYATLLSVQQDLRRLL